MKVNQINSVLFHTQNLAAVRQFYSDVLGLAVGTYEKNGRLVPDESETKMGLSMRQAV